MRKTSLFLSMVLLGVAGCAGEDPATSEASAAGGPGGGAELNGCKEDTAEDRTADAAVTIETAGTAYTPACIRVKVGTAVTINSNFGIHPLKGGDAASGAADEGS